MAAAAVLLGLGVLGGIIVGSFVGGFWVRADDAV